MLLRGNERLLVASEWPPIFGDPAEKQNVEIVAVATRFATIHPYRVGLPSCGSWRSAAHEEFISRCN
jgi:hypothetical protein